MQSQWQQEYEADKKLMVALDARTEIPHLLIELRSLGFIEICGKDMGGIYQRLEEWMSQNWGCEYMQVELRKEPDPSAFQHTEEGWTEGFVVRQYPLKDYNRLCDASFHWLPNQPLCKCMPCCGKKTVTVFKTRGSSGENNMGKLTMQLIEFMTHTCGWGLKLCNGTNLGFNGQIREQQIKFKAPHPLNLIAPHLMIELRQAGWIEVNGPNTEGIHEKLEQWLKDTWKAQRSKADPHYCDVKFCCSAFKKRGNEGENNMGMRTMEIVDFMVQKCAWTMITCNGGNYGRYGDIREQQMVFRNDGHVQHGEDHIMVELRDIGYIEVNGLSSSSDIEPFVDSFLKGSWQCTDYKSAGFWERDKFCDRKYVTPQGLYYKQGLTNNIGKLTVELSMALASQGWMLMLCSGGHTSTIKSPSNTTNMSAHPAQRITEIPGGIKREQQIKFTRARAGERTDEPLLMIELRAVPKDPPDIQQPGYDMFRTKYETAKLSQRESAKVRDWIARGEYQGLIEVNGFNTNGVYQKLDGFIRQYMRGTNAGPTEYCDCLFKCGVFRQKMSHHSEFWDGYYCGENNFGKYSMRLCDFLVDHVGEWDLIVCNGNSAERAWLFSGIQSLVAREQQLVFRHRPRGRAVFMANILEDAPLGRPPMHSPEYWKECSRQGSSSHEVVPATEQELRWIQELVDGTYIKKVTRDRRSGKLADRFAVVAAVRSENTRLWDAFAQRRADVGERIVIQDKQGVCKFWAKGSCKYGESCKYKHVSVSEFITPKTMLACPELVARCALPSGGNPSNEAILMHGTNPTSAVAILRTDFKIDLAGASAGTMFGPGAYLAEASTKADEYSQDDKDGAYKGLHAMVICRAVVGRPFVSEKPGNYSESVRSDRFHCVLGDREKAVGTFREFIFFHEESIYPEYAVFYRREFNSGATDEPFPPAPVQPDPPADAPQSPALALPGPINQMWQVKVPSGCFAGSAFQFKTTDGRLIEVTVPQGYRPGSILSIKV